MGGTGSLKPLPPPQKFMDLTTKLDHTCRNLTLKLSFNNTNDRATCWKLLCRKQCSWHTTKARYHHTMYDATSSMDHPATDLSFISCTISPGWSTPLREATPPERTREMTICLSSLHLTVAPWGRGGTISEVVWPGLRSLPKDLSFSSHKQFWWVPSFQDCWYPWQPRTGVGTLYWPPCHV